MVCSEVRKEETLIFLLQRGHGDGRQDGVLVVVAHRTVDGADDLGLPDPNSADKPGVGFKEALQHLRAQRDYPGRSSRVYGGSVGARFEQSTS